MCTWGTRNTSRSSGIDGIIDTLRVDSTVSSLDPADHVNKLHVLRHVMSVVSGLGTRLASTCLPTKRSVFKRGMEEDTLELFQSIGLSESKAKETAKNGPVSATLKALIVQVGTVDIDNSENRKECLLVTWGGAYAERKS